MTNLRFYFPGILVGPYLDFQEYTNLINEAPFQHAQVKAPISTGRRLPPGRKRAAFTKLFMGIFFLGVFTLYGKKYNFSVALNPDFAKKSLLQRSVHSLTDINLDIQVLFIF